LVVAVKLFNVIVVYPGSSATFGAGTPGSVSRIEILKLLFIVPCAVVRLTGCALVPGALFILGVAVNVLVTFSVVVAAVELSPETEKTFPDVVIFQTPVEKLAEVL